jgi:hypothetical protein
MEEELSFCEFERMVTLDLRSEAVGFLFTIRLKSITSFHRGAD